MGQRNLNLELFEYGIVTESSDIRAHVSGEGKMIYVFQTKSGIEAIKKNRPRLADATQPGANGITTGRGWLVKHDWISGLRKLPYYWWPGWQEYNENWNTTKKGSWAVACVLDLMRTGRFPLWIDTTEDDRKNLQLKGTDILIFARKRIQVKCDYRAGKTGNLFLQKAERNLFKHH